MSASQVLGDAGIDFDFDAELTDESVKAEASPLTGSRSRSTGSGTGQRRGRGVAAKRLANLQVKLSQEMFQAGAMIGMGLPVTGYYACQESDNFTKAVVQLASKRTEWVEALEHLADIQPGIVVGRTAIGLGAALAVDRGRADPEKKFMQFLGVHQAWASVNDIDTEITPHAYVPPPAVFTPV